MQDNLKEINFKEFLKDDFSMNEQFFITFYNAIIDLIVLLSPEIL